MKAVTFLVLCFFSAVVVSADVNVSQIHLSLSGDESVMGIDYVCDAGEACSYIHFKHVNELHNMERSKYIYMENIGYLHRVSLSNLTLSAEHHYRIGDGVSDFGKFYKFNTGPYRRSDFARKGDSSTEGPGVAAIYADLGLSNGLSINRLKLEAELGTYDHAVLIGDISYNLFNEDSAVGNEFMDVMQPAYAHVPINMAEGNHEEGDNFTEYNLRFKATQDLAGELSQSHSNHFYSFNVGLIHYVVVSTEVYSYPASAERSPSPFTAQEQLEWLEHDLEAANVPAQREKTPWIVLMGHRPWYTQLHGFSQLDDLACKFGVDLYITGHVHNYQRWFPMRVSALAPSDALPDEDAVSNPIPAYVDQDCVSEDKHTYTNPKYMPVIVAGSTGCHSPMPRAACPVMQAGARLFFGESLADCSAAYGFGHLQAVNSTHLYWEFVQSHVAHSVKNDISAAQVTDTATSNTDAGSVAEQSGEEDELYREFTERDRADIAEGFKSLLTETVTLDTFLSEVNSANENLRMRERRIQDELQLDVNRAADSKLVRDYLWIVQDSHGARDYC